MGISWRNPGGVGRPDADSAWARPGRAVTLACLAVVVCARGLSPESWTLNTSYPVRYGVYNELRSVSNSYLAHTSGGVLVGTTGTAAQKLDVRGNAYVSGSLGIGNTSPSYAIDVNGEAQVSGIKGAGCYWKTFTNGGTTSCNDTANERLIHARYTASDTTPCWEGGGCYQISIPSSGSMLCCRIRE